LSRVLLTVCGGVAAFKGVLLLRELQRAGHEVQVVLTKSALRFVGEPTWHALLQRAPHVDGWALDGTRGGELHIELAAWADAHVVYPATYQFVGAAAAGLADTLALLTFASVSAPRLVCPAMHHAMDAQDLHRRSRTALQDAGVAVLEPVVGPLASGEVGAGRLPEPADALAAIETLLAPSDLAGRTVVVSAGPTREHVDAVRFLSNPSTGRMGYAVARAAARRGADVVLVSGPAGLAAPAGVELVSVRSAEQMADAVHAAAEGADVVVMAAAVGDYRPGQVHDGKLAKSDAPLVLELERTRDILAELAAKPARPLLVGFAMETGDLVAKAQAKRARKGCELLVANDLTVEGAGFGTDTNVVALVTEQQVEELPRMSKLAVADAIWDRVAGLLGAR